MSRMLNGCVTDRDNSWRSEHDKTSDQERGRTGCHRPLFSGDSLWGFLLFLGADSFGPGDRSPDRGGHRGADRAGDAEYAGNVAGGLIGGAGAVAGGIVDGAGNVVLPTLGAVGSIVGGALGNVAGIAAASPEVVGSVLAAPLEALANFQVHLLIFCFKNFYIYLKVQDDCSNSNYFKNYL